MSVEFFDLEVLIDFVRITMGCGKIRSSCKE